MRSAHLLHRPVAPAPAGPHAIRGKTARSRMLRASPCAAIITVVASCSGGSLHTHGVLVICDDDAASVDVGG